MYFHIGHFCRYFSDIFRQSEKACSFIYFWASEDCVSLHISFSSSLHFPSSLHDSHGERLYFLWNNDRRIVTFCIFFSSSTFIVVKEDLYRPEAFSSRFLIASRSSQRREVCSYFPVTARHITSEAFSQLQASDASRYWVSQQERLRKATSRPERGQSASRGRRVSLSGQESASYTGYICIFIGFQLSVSVGREEKRQYAGVSFYSFLSQILADP